MSSKLKINLMVIFGIISFMGIIYLITVTNTWMHYGKVNVKNEVDIYPANDYPISGSKEYFYEVKTTVEYSSGSWPMINEKIVKSDTLLLLHDCSGDN